jgi:small subunit ribosomal protein S1
MDTMEVHVSGLALSGSALSGSLGWVAITSVPPGADQRQDDVRPRGKRPPDRDLPIPGAVPYMSIDTHTAPNTTSPQVAVNDIGSEEDFLAAIDKTIKYFNDGDIVEGTIVKVDRDEVLLDIGYKTEGVIPSRELSIKHDVDPHEVVAVGDEVEALVLQKEDKEGRLILSKKRAQYERAWGTIEQLKDNDEPVKGTVIEVVKGGLILDIGLRGFLPASLVEMRRVRDLQPYVGKEIEAKIIELDKNRNNVVLSRRAWLEQTQSAVRSEFLNQLAKGQIRKGQVSSIVNFGAFVDLGGVDGLVHVSELSWKHIDHPSEVVEVGQEVTVEVLDVDLDRERVSLSLKATQEDPWRQFARTHQIGQIVPGKVTKLVPFGAFVRVDEGIEGLVHISELAERHVEVPEQVVQVGNDVMVKVIDIDLDRRRISLSLKQANEGMTPETEFDPALYGMGAEYDDAGNYIYPEGFDPDSGEWREGFESQREEWERQYQAAYARYQQHIAQLQRTAEQEAEAAEAAPANYSSGGPASAEEDEDDDEAAAASSSDPGQGPPSASGGGALASDAQLAALREKLSGN